MMSFNKSSRKGKLAALLLIVALLMAQAVTPIFASEGYSFLLKWGSEGTGDGQFDRPSAIAVDSSGNVYVADTNNFRIQKFDANGAFLTKWGSQGNGDGEFGSPRGIGVDAAGNVYVVDIDNFRIQKFDANGAFLTKWGSQGSGDGQFYIPDSVAVDSSGNVYVVDTGNHRIQKFDANGAFLTKWGSQGSGDGEFGSPRGIAVDAAGNVFVVDFNNNNIHKFTSSGEFLTKWGTVGDGDGQFNSPYGIAVDAAGNVYVSDYSNHRIQKFDSNGYFIAKWGSWGIEDGELKSPMGVAVDAAGNVYVADRGNHRIQKFSKSTRGISVTADVEETQPMLTFSITAGTAPVGGSVSDSAIDFGPLAPETPKTGSHILTVSTNAAGGYMVTAEEDDALTSGSNQIPDVTGDVGFPITEEVAGKWSNSTTYGFGYTLAGDDAAFTPGYKQFANIAGGKTPQIIMSNSDPVTGSQVELTYKVNIGPEQPAGNYSNTITYIITGNF